MTAVRTVPFPNHPNLSAIYDEDWVEKCGRKFASSPNKMYRCLCDESPTTDKLRDDLEALFGLGHHMKLMDEQLIGRLRKLDELSWLSAIAELEAAQLFSDEGFEFSAKPAGRSARVGEFQIGSQPPVFVEVKTLFEDSDGILHERVRRKLWKSVKAVGQSTGASYFVGFGRVRRLADFSQRSFQEELTRVFSTDRCPSFTYQDKSGFSVDITLTPKSTGKPASPSGPWQGLWGNQNAAYERAIGRALKQLPDDRPNLLIIRPYLSFPLDREDIQELTEWCFDSCVRTRLSALGLMKDSGDARILEVHENPFAAMRLPSIFRNLPTITFEAYD